MATRMQQRRGTAAQWAAVNPVLADGEVGWDRTNKILKFGDGVTPWAQLPIALDGLWLPVGGKAYDSDRLDGLDSTAFLKVNDGVVPATPDSLARRGSTGTLIGATATLPTELTTLAQQSTAITAGRRETISRVPTAATTLALTDEGSLVSFNAAAAVVCTIPTNAAVAFSVGAWVDIETIKGSAPVTITPAAGVTIRTPVTGYPLVCLDAYAPVRLLKIGTDEWMPIDGTIDTGVVSGAATAPWTSSVTWRVKNGFCFFTYANVSSGATPSGSIIYTFPVGARLASGTVPYVSIYAGTAREVNLNSSGVLSLNAAQAAASGVAVTGTYPVLTP